MINVQHVEHSFQDPWTGHDWSAWLKQSPNRHCLVAKHDDGVAVGFAVYQRNDDHIAVEKLTAKGELAASELIKSLVFQLFGQVIRLEIIIDEDSAMLRVLQNHGFRAIELIKRPNADMYRMAFGNQDQTKFRRQQRDQWRPENRISKHFQSDL